MYPLEEVEYILEELNYLKEFASASYEWGSSSKVWTLIPDIDAEAFKEIIDTAMEMIANSAW